MATLLRFEPFQPQTTKGDICEVLRAKRNDYRQSPSLPWTPVVPPAAILC